MRLLVSLIIGLFTSSAMAGDFFLLEMGDVVLKSNKGQDTIRLKRELRDQYGNHFRGAELLSVMMVAKTAAGKGKAQLVVGPHASAKQVVGGSRPQWTQDTQANFDRVLFQSPTDKAKGKWQIHLQGNFKVHQIMVEVDMNPMLSFPMSYDGFHTKTGKGGQDTLFLKRKANQLGIDHSDMDLVAVTLVAKSKQGGGKATLNVGGAMSATQTIAGTPGTFGSAGAYHTMKFENPKGNSDGAWQIKLKGNIKVQEVILHVKSK